MDDEIRIFGVTLDRERLPAPGSAWNVEIHRRDGRVITLERVIFQGVVSHGTGQALRFDEDIGDRHDVPLRDFSGLVFRRIRDDYPRLPVY